MTVLVGGLLLVYLVYNLNRQRETKQRIFATIQGHSFTGNNAATEGQLRDKRRASLARKLKDSEQKKDTGKKDTLRPLLLQAGIEMSPLRFWIFSLLSGLLFAGLSSVLHAQQIIVILLSIVGVFGFPRFVLKKIAQRRQKKFLADFADALEAMIRLLKAGMPIAESVSMVAREFTGPMGQIMGRIYDQQKLGTPLAEAVMAGTTRMPIPEMNMFATAIAIQQQTGSSLSEVLGNLSRVIRARFRLKRKVQALSAEAKASAAIIGALPFLVSGGLYAINPDYMDVLFTTPTGKVLLTGALIWMGMGILVMKQMINFKV
ncbi:MAG: type II secretion protein F [Alphaproteobacteria bacterium]|nr:type II secretion protein F [Alphaproteobacteria bacterium]